MASLTVKPLDLLLIEEDIYKVDNVNEDTIYMLNLIDFITTKILKYDTNEEYFIDEYTNKIFRDGENIIFLDIHDEKDYTIIYKNISHYKLDLFLLNLVKDGESVDYFTLNDALGKYILDSNKYLYHAIYSIKYCNYGIMHYLINEKYVNIKDEYIYKTLYNKSKMNYEMISLINSFV